MAGLGEGPLKVLHVNPHLDGRGGVETYLGALIPLMAARGTRQHVAFEGGGCSVEVARTVVAGIGGGARCDEDRAHRELAALLARERPAVVHVHNVGSVGALRACLEYGRAVATAHDYRMICPANTFFLKGGQTICAKAHGDPGCFATTLRGRCMSLHPLHGPAAYRRTRWTVGRAAGFARVIAPSGDAAERLTRAGFPRERVTVLPYFCSVPVRPAPRPRPGTPTISFIGRTTPSKGVDHFVAALARLPAEVMGLVVGNLDAGKRSALAKLAHRWGCEDRLRFRPWASRDELTAILDETSVLIFPSLWPETLGIIGLEALARGVPVVASDVGGVREWLEDGRNGYLVPPKDAAAIAASVMTILDAPDRLDQLGRAGIDTIRARFSPERHADALAALYEQAARAEPRGAA